jgi:hypothetical protein
MAKVTSRQDFIDAVVKHFGKIPNEISRAQILEVVETYGVDRPNWLWNDTDPAVRIGRGVYDITAAVLKSGGKAPKASKAVAAKAPSAPKVAPAPVSRVPVSSAPIPTTDSVVAASSGLSVARSSRKGEDSELGEVSFVPEKMRGYVPFGHFADIRSIIKSKIFYPSFVTGLSGNGKTLTVEQVCAAEKRELIRVNVTIETDEDDLLGGFRLIDGHTVWQDGPVVVAMERGAVLLLDEVDLASNKIMCLQPILEGKSAYLKKINRIVHPTLGFNIVATANTKGKGSDDGRFIGTNVLNEAFLDRFAITLEQEYPPSKTENKILTNVLAEKNIEDKKFVECLVYWAEVVRKTFYEGALQEIITTRRLVDICRAYAIFGQNKEKAIDMCLARFDIETKTAFKDLYKKVDDSLNPPPAAVAPVETAPVESDKEFVF